MSDERGWVRPSDPVAMPPASPLAPDPACGQRINDSSKRLRFNRGSEDLDFNECVRAASPATTITVTAAGVSAHRRLPASIGIGKSFVRVRKNVILTIWRVVSVVKKLCP
jgi:hypothetical protein